MFHHVIRRFAFALILFGLPVSLVPAGESRYAEQAKEDARQDVVHVIFDGKSPNKLACDTTLREMSDGSWVMVMLGGGDREPLPENRVFITRSRDRGKTWSPVEPIDLGVKAKDPVVALVPSELMGHAGRWTLFVATHDLESAERESRQAVSLAPSESGYLVNLGYVLLRQDRLVDAEMILKRAIQADPRSADAFNQLGLVLALQKRESAAMDNFKKALELDPDHRAAKENLDAVQHGFDFKGPWDR